MFKDILLKIYHYFNPSKHGFEHLGRIAMAIESNDSQVKTLSSIYTTGLFSVSMVSQKNAVVKETLSVADDQSITQEVLELSEEKQNSFYNKSENVPNTEQSLTEEQEDTISIEEPKEVAEIKNINESVEEIEATESENTNALPEINESITDSIEDGVFSTKVEPAQNENQIIIDVAPEHTPGVVWEDVDIPIIDGKQHLETAEDDSHKKATKNSKKKVKKSKAISKVKKRKSTKQPNKFKHSDFSNWLLELAPLEEAGLKSATKKAKKKKKKKKAKKKLSAVEQSAQDSITLKNEIASETLATILANQGHKDEAVAMYRKLIELQPTKKEDLEKKIFDLLNR